MVLHAGPLSRLLVAIVALLAFAIAIFAWRSASAKTVAVEVGNNYFCSAAFDGYACTTNVLEGDTVRWTIVGGAHTVTECNDDFSQCPPAGGWDSGIVSKDDTFSQVFLNLGVFEYRCELHPSEMVGFINVLGFDPTPTASPTAAPTASLAAPTAEPTNAPAPAAGTSTPVALPQTGGIPNGGASVILYVPLGLVLFVGAALAFVGARRRA